MPNLAIIIPAWRCAASIGRSLSALAAQAGTSLAGTRLVIAVNDGLVSSMAAAEAHRPALEQAGYDVRIIATPLGRAAAIAAAEALCPPGPRLYVDQDAILSAGALAAFRAATADPGQARFIAFTLRFSPSPSALVRAFLSGWLSLPYVRESPVVAGVYGVSAAGRQRWQRLPAGLPDDKYVRLRFARAERLLLADHSYQVLAPASWRELLAARTRYARSNRRLARHLAGSMGADDAPRHAGLHQLLARPLELAVIAITSALAAMLALRA